MRNWKDPALLFLGFLIAIAFSLSAFASEESNYKLGLVQSFSKSKNQNARDLEAYVGYKYKKANQIQLNYKKKKRLYLSGSHLNDESWGLEGTSKISDFYYLDSSVSYSPLAKFFPTTHIQMEPHFVAVKLYDLSLGLKAAFYRNITTYTVMPSVLREFENEKLLQFRGFVTIGDRSPVYSVMAAYSFNVFDSLKLRNDFSFGNSYEDINLHDPFWSFGLALEQKLNESFKFQMQGLIYQGKVRKENSIALGVECKF